MSVFATSSGEIPSDFGLCERALRVRVGKEFVAHAGLVERARQV
jgi:hypothetical protein